jgi:protein-tyrosine phosphatase
MTAFPRIDMAASLRGAAVCRPPGGHSAAASSSPSDDTVDEMSLAHDGFAPDPTALDRSVQLDVVFNVRDLGGLPTVDGAEVRRGRVFRADGVNRLRGDDLEVVRGLGLRTVIDLRTEGEVRRHGRFPVEEHPVDWYALPMIQRMWSEDDLVATTGAADFLRDRYLDMLTDGAESLARIIELVADGQPALFHCAAGKDRTGVVAAVLLGLVGVERQEIVADYHATAGAMAAFVDWLTTEHPEAIDSMTSQPPEYLEAPPEAMARFLDEVDARYGSMEGLADHLGVPASTVDRLRDTLVA